MYHILICDDEQDIVNALKIYLMNPDFKRSHIALITFFRPYILLMVQSPHRYAPRKYNVSFSATAGSRSPST